MKKIIIAIDGYSSCGKSTMARALARKIGYVYIDTGAMYRAVTLYCLQNGLIKNGNIDIQTLRERMPQVKISFTINPQTGGIVTHLNGQDVESAIRTLEVSQNVSAVAALPFVREALTVQQRGMGNAKGIVMDGRDIGTTVFPNAELKIFVTASPEVRAQRRYDELTQKGQKVSFDEILKNVQQRDYVDTHREVSPLTKADDALVLDNSNLTIAQQDEWLLEHFRQAAQ